MNRRLQFEPNLFGKQTWLEDPIRNWVLSKLTERVEQFPHNRDAGVKSIPVLQVIPSIYCTKELLGAKKSRSCMENSSNWNGFTFST